MARDYLHSRFTPTCVGTMLLCCARYVRLTVHPHMRGDNLLGVLPSSSPHPVHPHMRGDNATSSGGLAHMRFTPTCVGTIIQRPCRSAPDGSPPHAWGQYRAAMPERSRSRFTPTCVGTIRRCQCCTVPGGSPPHAWGQLSSAHDRRHCVIGSPPHAWGQYSTTGARWPWPVHPHMRGDNVHSRGAPSAFGSPPHAWGQ